MATNQTGIAIVIRAFLPIGKDLDQQLAALTLVKSSHETGDYAPLLAAAKIDEVKTEQKTRRVEEAVTITVGSGDVFADLGVTKEPAEVAAMIAKELEETGIAPDPNDSADIPQFLKKKSKAA